MTCAGCSGQNDELLTAADAARLLGIAKQTLSSWRVSGRGPRHVKTGAHFGGRCYYSRADIESFIESHKRYSTSEHIPAAPVAA